MSKISGVRRKAAEDEKIVLVGTYKNGQLERWPGWYNYPISAKDKIDEQAAKRVTELWLFRGKEDGRYFAAEFVGVKTRSELVSDYGYKAAGKPHGEKYLLYKLGASLYEPVGGFAEKVIVRAADFARTPKVRKRYLESPDRNDPLTANMLPTILTKLPPEQLRVCDSGIQLGFVQILHSGDAFPAVETIEYVGGAIRRHPKIEIPKPQTKGGMPFRLGEFFCGPGGLACGAMSAAIENPLFKIAHAWANDYDQQTCNTYAENICRDRPETVICHDVRKLSLDDNRLTPIDGFAFGFPCNDFSVVGEHKGIEGNYGPLYQYGVAVLKKFQPLWFVAENVGGLASANEGAAFKKILNRMKEAGYRIYPHLYKFEDSRCDRVDIAA